MEERALGLRKNRDRGYASPSIRRRSDRRVRHTRLKPTDNLPNALSSFEDTRAYHLDRWPSSCPISDNFSWILFRVFAISLITNALKRKEKTPEANPSRSQTQFRLITIKRDNGNSQSYQRGPMMDRSSISRTSMAH